MRRYANTFSIIEQKTTSEFDKGLLPIMNPLFNMREICKQVVLLEDHLNNVRKRCHDCIRKHFLTIEAFFEEAISLDKELKYLDLLEGKAEQIRELQYAWLRIKDDKSDFARKGYYLISQQLRKFRKELTPYCFDVVEMDSSPFNKKFACSLATCPHRVAKLYLATKTVTEKEDKEVSSMVKPHPKKKPPRQDLKKTRMSVDDRDLEDLSGDGDRDLSLHNTKVGYFFR